VKLAEAQGVPASRARSLDALAKQLQSALENRGPYLIDLVL
jgi:thiamine pyrophosphate-dependent acetolactate synthase large subunit-like protein